MIRHSARKRSRCTCLGHGTRCPVAHEATAAQRARLSHTRRQESHAAVAEWADSLGAFWDPTGPWPEQW